MSPRTAPQPAAAGRIAEVVEADMCIGCGLCETVTDGRIQMTMTAAGSLRPHPVDGITPEEDARLIEACPGAVAEIRLDQAPEEPRTLPDVGSRDTAAADEVWGAFKDMRYAWAGDPEVRHRSATGGALTALGITALRCGAAEFVLHVGARPDKPMRSRWTISETPDQVFANCGSRYGPTAPLAGLGEALARRRPFAVIAKPCDLAALHSYARVDPSVDEFCNVRLALVCGGQSRLSKSQTVLAEFDVDEAELTLFRYRGFGNPGATRVETADGRAFTKTYLELWEDASGWDVETRCKLCPDALGEASDVAAADVWPGGAPDGEDDGFNGIIVRTAAGAALVASAVADEALVLGGRITPRSFDDFQPHQVRKKRALAARYEGMSDAGATPIRTRGLRIGRLGRHLTPAEAAAERAGAERRFRQILSRDRSEPATALRPTTEARPIVKPEPNS